jgi:hypothetical protein
LAIADCGRPLPAADCGLNWRLRIELAIADCGCEPDTVNAVVNQLDDLVTRLEQELER